MRRSRRNFVEKLLTVSGSAAVVAAVAGGAAALPVGASPLESDFSKATIDGRVVCYTDAFARQHGINPECESPRVVWGLAATDGRLFSFLPTDTAAAIWDDQRFRERELRVTGRLFPGTTWLEVITLQSIRDGRLFDLYYFCEVCNLRTHKPGPCICCQDPVVFHEDPAESDQPGR